MTKHNHNVWLLQFLAYSFLLVTLFSFSFMVQGGLATKSQNAKATVLACGGLSNKADCELFVGCRWKTYTCESLGKNDCEGSKGCSYYSCSSYSNSKESCTGNTGCKYTQGYCSGTARCQSKGQLSCSFTKGCRWNYPSCSGDICLGGTQTGCMGGYGTSEYCYIGNKTCLRGDIYICRNGRNYELAKNCSGSTPQCVETDYGPICGVQRNEI